MVEGEAMTATDRPKSARGRVRVGCARGGEAASAKFELTEHLVTTVNLGDFLNRLRRLRASAGERWVRPRGLVFDGRICIGENFGKLSKSGFEIESPR